MALAARQGLFEGAVDTRLASNHILACSSTGTDLAGLICLFRPQALICCFLVLVWAYMLEMA